MLGSLVPFSSKTRPLVGRRTGGVIGHIRHIGVKMGSLSKYFESVDIQFSNDILARLTLRILLRIGLHLDKRPGDVVGALRASQMCTFGSECPGCKSWRSGAACFRRA